MGRPKNNHPTAHFHWLDGSVARTPAGFLFLSLSHIFSTFCSCRSLVYGDQQTSLEADVNCSNIMHTLPSLCSAALSLSSIITIMFTERFQFATLCAYYYSILQMKKLRFTEVKSLAQPRSQTRKWLIPRYSESLFIISYHIFSLCRCPNPLKWHPRALLFFT